MPTAGVSPVVSSSGCQLLCSCGFSTSKFPSVRCGQVDWSSPRPQVEVLRRPIGRHNRCLHTQALCVMSTSVDGPPAARRTCSAYLHLGQMAAVLPRSSTSNLCFPFQTSNRHHWRLLFVPNESASSCGSSSIRCLLAGIISTSSLRLFCRAPATKAPPWTDTSTLDENTSHDGHFVPSTRPYSGLTREPCVCVAGTSCTDTCCSSPCHLRNTSRCAVDPVAPIDSTGSIR